MSAAAPGYTTHVMDGAMSAPAPETRRNLKAISAKDVWAISGAAVSAFSVASLMYFQLAALSGALGLVVLTYVLFLGFYGLLISLEDNSQAVRDRVVMVAVHSLAFLLGAALVSVVVYTAIRGYHALPHGNFYKQSMANAGPLDPLSVGGIVHAMVGTLIMITIALLITVPLGITCALFLNEMPGRFARFCRTIVEAMTALPSIVAGLFIYATFILILGFDKSGFAASLAISVMMLPIIIRASDVVIRLVPGSLKEASYALGCSQWRTVWHVVLPTARSGLTTAVILGAARGLGETSPVLVTAGFTAALNTNPFHGPMISLPLAVFNFVKSPQNSMIERGFGTAIVLLVLVLVLFIIARIIGGRAPGNLSKRQVERRVALSAKDVERFSARGARVFAQPAPAVASAGSIDLRNEPPSTGMRNA